MQVFYRETVEMSVCLTQAEVSALMISCVDAGTHVKRAMESESAADRSQELEWARQALLAHHKRLRALIPSRANPETC